MLLLTRLAQRELSAESPNTGILLDFPPERRPAPPPRCTAFVVLHREEKEHDGEREGAVPQHFLHAGVKNFIGVIAVIAVRTPSARRRISDAPPCPPGFSVTHRSTAEVGRLFGDDQSSTPRQVDDGQDADALGDDRCCWVVFCAIRIAPQSTNADMVVS